MPRRFCFVIPRFFEGLAGGAETLVSKLATQVAACGHSVELLATCARDNRTWQNELPEGASTLKGIALRRFPVDSRDLQEWIPIQQAIHSGQRVSHEQQLVWMEESVNSLAMYRYIVENQDRFDLFFFGPYLFGTTFWGSQIVPHKSILIPCLHNETYAYLEIVASMFRSVRGCIFNALPEQQLANALYGELPGGVVGMGFEGPSANHEGEEHYFEENFPYVLYLGRKETGKNAHVLVDYFCQAKSAGLIPTSCKLVVLGGGSFEDLHRQEALQRDDILDLPHVSEVDKRRIVSGALCLCQPSCNESFSIVLMEAWQQKVPVVVHAECPVTRYHVEESGGGLYFASPEEFGGVIRYLLEDSSQQQVMAQRGFQYVEAHYSWERVLSRFFAVLDSIESSPLHST